MGAMAEMPDQGQSYDLQTQLNAVRKAASGKRLSVRQINQLSDRVAALCQKIGKVQRVAGAAFASSDLLTQGIQIAEDLEDKRKSAWLSDQKILKKIHVCDFEVEKLRDEILFLTSQEVGKKLADLYVELKDIQEEKERSPRVERAIFHTLEHIAEIDFVLKFPTYFELFEDSYQENYIQKMHKLSEHFNRSPRTAFLEFLLLSERQKKEIYAAFARRKEISLEEAAKVFHHPDTSSKEKGDSVEDHLAELADLCSLAKIALYQDSARALFLYKGAPEEIQTRMSQLIWQRTGKNGEEFFHMDAEFLREVFPRIIMELVEEKMLA